MQRIGHKIFQLRPFAIRARSGSDFFCMAQRLGILAISALHDCVICCHYCEVIRQLPGCKRERVRATEMWQGPPKVKTTHNLSGKRTVCGRHSGKRAAARAEGVSGKPWRFASLSGQGQRGAISRQRAWLNHCHWIEPWNIWRRELAWRDWHLEENTPA